MATISEHPLRCRLSASSCSKLISPRQQQQQRPQSQPKSHSESESESHSHSQSESQSESQSQPQLNKRQLSQATSQQPITAFTPATIFCLIGACSLLAIATAFPSGAPETACKDLKPGHGGEAAEGSAPFELTQDRLQVEAGDQIKVTLSSPSKDNFKGLIVQALNEKGEPKGKFLAGKGLKTLDSCSAVTHSDREAKKTATLVWEAPSELKSKEAFMFRATVVRKFDEFYMNIKSTLGSS